MLNTKDYIPNTANASLGTLGTFASAVNGANQATNTLLSQYKPTSQNSGATLGTAYTGIPINQAYQNNSFLNQQIQYEPQQIPNTVNQQVKPQQNDDFFKNILGNNYDPNAGTLGNSLNLIDTIGGVAGGLMNLYGAWQSIGLANRKMDMLDQQMRIIGQQWADAQKEKAYIRNARVKIANKFNGIG